MSNLDLINAYFGNEMTEVEKQAFENRLQKDPELNKEFEFQKDIVDAIKQARTAELKAMLDKVPAGAGTASDTFTMGKVLSTAAIIGIVALGIYYFWPAEQAATNETPGAEVTVVTPEEEDVIEEVETEEEEKTPLIAKNKGETEKPALNTSEKVVVTEKSKEETENVISAQPEINKPDPIPTFDTQEDINDSLEAPGGSLITKPEEGHSTLDVEIDNTHKNFTFHYQFKSGKLFLYGSFDKGLYEILEINSRGEKTLFLYYKDKFYPLRTNQIKIIPLEPVKESSLIEKLEKARDEG